MARRKSKNTRKKTDNRVLKIVVPMAGEGTRFKEAGYSFPKPLIDIKGKPMIQVVVENLKPKVPHKFIFIARQVDVEQYSLEQIFSNLTKGNYSSIKTTGATAGALATVMGAVDEIDGDDDLLIANADQIIDTKIDTFLNFARKGSIDGAIMTFTASHPKWSYARVGKRQVVLETAEKKVISDNATVGLYYFRKGSDFIEASKAMIEKNIRTNNEFYVCPAYNEMILRGKKIKAYEIKASQMHGLGTPEDLKQYLGE